MAPDDRPALIYTTICFLAVAGLTWFFSSRPRLFIRLFVPADELRRAVRGILRDSQFTQGMRVIALLQVAVATAIGVAAVWCWFTAT